MHRTKWNLDSLTQDWNLDWIAGFFVDKQLHSTPVAPVPTNVPKDTFDTVHTTLKGTVTQDTLRTETSINPMSAITKSSDSVATRGDSQRENRVGASLLTETYMYSPQSSELPHVVPSQSAIIEERAPRDHVAAMWKVQLLSGIEPTQFSGRLLIQ